MDRKALYDLSYGVFLLSAKAGDRGERLHHQHLHSGGEQPGAGGVFRAEREPDL